jgi:3-oxoacyl-[acyl-carrier protein] reductase
MNFENKTVVVTGASRGLGKNIALAFANEGANLVINYRSNDSSADEVVSQISKMGGNAIKYKADVTDRDSIKRMFQKVSSEFRAIDILINNAGINIRGTFDEISDPDWDKVMSVNLKGPFICCQEVFPFMRKQNEGRIINISSAASQYHGPKTLHYAVSKAGLNSLTKVIARYGAEHNILVNAVAPGIIMTDQTKDEIASPAGQVYLDMTLLNRYGNAKDVTTTCLFLASEQQNYITGQVLSVSGGAYM